MAKILKETYPKRHSVKTEQSIHSERLKQNQKLLTLLLFIQSLRKRSKAFLTMNMIPVKPPTSLIQLDSFLPFRQKTKRLNPAQKNGKSILHSYAWRKTYIGYKNPVTVKLPYSGDEIDIRPDLVYDDGETLTIAYIKIGKSYVLGNEFFQPCTTQSCSAELWFRKMNPVRLPALTLR